MTQPAQSAQSTRSARPGQSGRNDEHAVSSPTAPTGQSTPSSQPAPMDFQAVAPAPPADHNEPTCPPPPAPIIINEAQLVLAEKRTSLAALRTGIAIVALPMSLTTFLIATSRYYDTEDVLHFLLPVGVLNLVLLVLGAWLSLRAVRRLRQQEQTLRLLKERNGALAEFLK
ncbi:hypothetical protein [Nitratidesulfovibrio liaohensis]|uniref:DUF202 domain-containing protein n=1 Tax=Nitratidesulfovibrio liaohensis TaxID=2604158 RepID=A0ABY9R511_9BACT|nr:hypothetical protein [Nitratidesulfovibrio liaohensis]WMW66406.1 hypothetical protein KPS_000976 [Nitratidesulfovibrio liaohensis]